MYTIAEQAEMLNISDSKVNRITRILNIKYDALQGIITDVIVIFKRKEKREKRKRLRLFPLLPL